VGVGVGVGAKLGGSVQQCAGLYSACCTVLSFVLLYHTVQYSPGTTLIYVPYCNSDLLCCTVICCVACIATLRRH
jgi:hypothetical protein